MSTTSYTQENVQEAIRALEDSCTVYKVSREYSAQRTLRDKCDEKYSTDVPGRKSILTKWEESKIVDWIHYLGKRGFTVTKKQLIQGVAKLHQNLNRPNQFNNGFPGKHWLNNFLSRHQTVAEIVQTSPTNRITEEYLRSWFHRLFSYFSTNNFLDVLEDESRVYTCDEIAFFLRPKKDIVTKKGSQTVYSRVADDENECLSVLVNVSAGGELAPPMVLYPYKRIPVNLALNVPSAWGLGCTESGWMDAETLYDYVVNIFHKWLLEKKVTMPVALFLDHKSQVSLPLSRICEVTGIILLALPNSSHVQPLNRGVFRPIEYSWKKIVHEFRLKKKGAQLRREDFARELQKCFQIYLNADMIKDSFKNAGIFPFDVSNIDFSEVCASTRETFLEEFEKRLAPEVLDLFVKSGNEWEGEERYRGLFEFWKRIRLEESESSHPKDLTNL